MVFLSANYVKKSNVLYERAEYSAPTSDLNDVQNYTNMVGGWNELLHLIITVSDQQPVCCGKNVPKSIVLLVCWTSWYATCYHLNESVGETVYFCFACDTNWTTVCQGARIQHPSGASVRTHGTLSFMYSCTLLIFFQAHFPHEKRKRKNRIRFSPFWKLNNIILSKISFSLTVKFRNT